MDDRGHEAKHPAGALEFVQGRPLTVEAVEQLRVDRVGGGESPLVVGLRTAARELGLLAAVKAPECLDDDVAIRSMVGWEVVEQATADDLEAFLGRRRPP